MSTKIYNAFHVKPEADVWSVLRDIRERGQKAVVAKLRAFYREKVDEVDTESPEFLAERKKDPTSDEVWLRLSFVDKQVRERFEANATSTSRDLFDLEVSVGVTHHETGYYLRAFCDRVSVLGGALDFLDKHPDLEDFHYQNQADQPHGVSDAEWERRRVIWDAMMDKSGLFHCQLVLEISSWGMYWRLNPWLDLAKEFRAHPPVFPCKEEVMARVLREAGGIDSVTACPGRLVCLTKAGGTITIEKARKRSQKGQWTSRVGGELKRHGSLQRAVTHVWLEHINSGWRHSLARAQKKLESEKKAKRRRRGKVRASSC